MKNNKGFTLVELVVAFGISTFLIGGIMFFFWEVVNSSTSLSVSSNLFIGTENIDDLITSYQKDYKFFEKINNTNFDSKKWADALLLTNDETTPTAWVLFWVYDNSDDEIVLWSMINYKDYRLFYKELDNAQVTWAIWDLSWTITALTKDDINIISNLHIIKFWVSSLEWKIKLDFRLTPIFYKKLKWENITMFDKNSEIEDYYISLLK